MNTQLPPTYTSSQSQGKPTEAEFVKVLERCVANLCHPRPTTQLEREGGDFVSEAYLRTRKKVAGFNPEKGVSFKNYMQPRITGAIIDYLRESEFVTRPYKEKEREIAKVRQELSCRLDHTPSYDELALELGQEELVKIKEDVALVSKAGERLEKQGQIVSYPVKNSRKGRKELEDEMQFNPNISESRVRRAIMNYYYFFQTREKLQAKLKAEPNQTQLARKFGEDYLDKTIGTPDIFTVLDKDIGCSVDPDDKHRYEPASIKNTTPDPKAEDPTENLSSLDGFLTLTKDLSEQDRLLLLLRYWEELKLKEIGKCLTSRTGENSSEPAVCLRHISIIKRLQQTHPKSRLEKLGIIK